MLAVKVQRSPKLAHGLGAAEDVMGDVGPLKNGQSVCPGCAQAPSQQQ